MRHEFTIQLEPRTKKNSQRIVKCGGYYRVLPSKAYMQYEKDSKIYIPRLAIDSKITVEAHFYMKTKRRVDLVNLLEALCDVLVAHGCIADDNANIIASMDGSRVYHDKDNPRTEVIIKDYE